MHTLNSEWVVRTNTLYHVFYKVSTTCGYWREQVDFDMCIVIKLSEDSTTGSAYEAVTRASFNNRLQLFGNLLTLGLAEPLCSRGVRTCSCGRDPTCHSISARLSFITWVFNSLPLCLWRRCYSRFPRLLSTLTSSAREPKIIFYAVSIWDRSTLDYLLFPAICCQPSFALRYSKCAQ